MMQKGKVKHYNSEKGYGFIDVDNQEEDVFFHISTWQALQSPNVGQTVYFESIYNNKRQLRATLVSTTPIKPVPLSLAPSKNRPSKNDHHVSRVSHKRNDSHKRNNSNDKKGGLTTIIGVIIALILVVLGGSELLSGNLVSDTSYSSTSVDSVTSSQTSDISAITGDAQVDKTIALIKQGGPFPYPQKDGTTFYNREGRLPEESRGYYREYTVPTPGLSHRGPRRIVTGGNPPKVYYLTVDHYDSFKKLDVN